MGIVCCRPTSFNPNSPKLLQLSRHIKRSSILSENSSPSDVTLNLFDIEEEEVFTSKVSLRILNSLKGMSQLNVENNLYLCGSEEGASIGSFLLKLDNTKGMTSTVSIMINAQYSHVYPSMIHVPKNSILVVGGKRQEKCEQFDITNSKWKYLPDLPEERYHSTLIMDNNKKYVYLFGGFCHNKDSQSKDNNKNCNEILRLNLENMMIWEKLLVVQGKELLERNSCGVVNSSDKDNIVYILGGKDNNKEITDDIIECDIKKRTAKKMTSKLKHKSSFINQQGVCVSATTFVLFNKKANVHRINITSFDTYTNIEDDEQLNL